VCLGSTYDIGENIVPQNVPLNSPYYVDYTNVPTRHLQFPVDNSLIPEIYRVGAGDAFIVMIDGEVLSSYYCMVKEGGFLVIPDAGVVDIGKMTLKDAKQHISEFVRSKSKNVDSVHISLASIKAVHVTITGDVHGPGTFHMYGSFRVADVIKYSNKDMILPLDKYDYRDVILQDDNDSICHYDLYEYFFKDIDEQNPYINGGDHIRINRALRRVYITGEIQTTISRFVPIKRGETLAHLLSLFPMKEAADSNHIVIQRSAGGGGQETIVTSLQDAESIIVHDNDVITVAPKMNYPEIQTVTIEGAIGRPGEYPIKDGTTLYEIIELAGKYTENAFKERTYVIRKKKFLDSPVTEPLDTLSNERKSFFNKLAANSQFSVRQGINTALWRAAATNEYSIITLEESGEQLALMDGDEIVIPKRENKIYVSGNVKNPGAYDYVKDKGHRYYINMAGGYKRQADKADIFIISSNNIRTQIRDVSELEDGDILVVPGKYKIKPFTDIIIPLLSILALTSSSLLNILSLTR
jgi:protein involved in polysaccharide export with SLBB domain